MTSHILVPALDPDRPATFSPAVLGGLRQRSGFAGAIVSDALDMAGASRRRGIPEAAVLALAAGVDLLCLGSETTAEQAAAVRSQVATAVAQGRLGRDRVLDAAARVRELFHGAARLRAVGTAGHPEPPAVDPAGFWLRAPLAPVRAPVLLRLASPAGIAAGETPWGVAGHLADEVDASLPGASCVTVGDHPALQGVLDADPARPLVVQGSDLSRVEFLRTASAVVLRRRPDAVIVELGWPYFGGPTRLDVVTFGSGRAAAGALVRLLARGTG